MARRILMGALLCGLLCVPGLRAQSVDAPPQTGANAQALTEEQVRPSATDPSLGGEFDKVNVIITPPSVAPDAPLVVFLPGTGGRPLNAMLIQRFVAGLGYRVIGLMYNDETAGSQICPNSPDRACTAQFRAMRSYGKGPATVSNTPAESIEGRLGSLLRYLNRQHPDAGWGQYLTPEGTPRWSRMVLSGLSQGAGMAAFIAKRYEVQRVVLFSSPWDEVGPEHRPASWLAWPSATPMDRWWAERHARENTTGWLAHAYSALNIPRDHIFVFDQGLAPGQNPDGENPYHPSTILNSAYEPQWAILFGRPNAAP